MVSQTHTHYSSCQLSIQHEQTDPAEHTQIIWLSTIGWKVFTQNLFCHNHFPNGFHAPVESILHHYSQLCLIHWQQLKQVDN